MSEFLDQSGLSTYSTLVRSSITSARPTVTLVTLKSTGWTNKTQTVTVAGISSDEAAQRINSINSSLFFKLFLSIISLRYTVSCKERR